jgi:hypothetical protein
MSQAQDARQVPLSKVDRLRADATDAAAVRAFQTHPDVVALRVESVRTQVDTLMWVGIVLGLAFTMVNVQTFAAAGAAVFTLPWLAAWLLDPMVSLVLIAVLRAEQVTARYQVETGTWVRRTKVFAFAATFTMNTWSSWASLHPAGIVLHSVPPILVYCAAEAGPTVRDRLTEAVLRAAHHAGTKSATGPVHEPALATPAATFTDTVVNTAANDAVNDPAGRPVNAAGLAREPVIRPAARPSRAAARKRPSKAPAPRRLKADYLATARAAWSPTVHVTPAWVREVTGCSRGLSSQIAADLKADENTVLTGTTVLTESSESEAA